MKFEERILTLKDGRACVLCPTTAAYAEEMIEYLKRTAGETPFLLRYPDEVCFTPEGEKAFLTGVYEDERSVMMLALVNGVLAGNASLAPLGTVRRVRHRCSLAIALKKEFWGLGIGTAMIGYMKELGKRAGYTQMELEVADGNEAAVKLYEKCGFTVTGRHMNAMRYDDGTCRDEWLMYTEL